MTADCRDDGGGGGGVEIRKILRLVVNEPASASHNHGKCSGVEQIN